MFRLDMIILTIVYLVTFFNFNNRLHRCYRICG